MSKARPGNYKRCISCEKEFTKEGSSAHNAAGRCKKCYGAYIRKNGYTHCQICGVELPSKLMKPNCKMCKLKVKSGLLETEKYIPTARSKYYTAHSERVAKSYQLTSKRLDQIKLILIKVRWKLITELDYFIIADYYLDIWGYEPTLDSAKREQQVEYMVKRLEDYYVKNKDLIYK